MAEKLDEFKKTFKDIEKRATDAASELDKSQRLMGQTTGIVQEGAKELGLRIQQLKDDGATGKELKDFLSDKEVKTIYGSIQDHMKTIEADIKRMTALQNGSFKKLREDYKALKRDMAAEIGQRKKATSTKVGVGNKSLPEMEKLLKTVQDYEDKKPYTLVDVFEAEQFSQHEKDLDRNISRELSSTKEIKLTAFQEMMQMQALDVRVLAGKFNRAKSLTDTVLAECAKAQDALKKRDNKALLTAKATAPAPMKELSDMADLYQKALADQWIASQLRKSKDKEKITKGVNGVIAMHAKAREEMNKIANARL